MMNCCGYQLLLLVNNDHVCMMNIVVCTSMEFARAFQHGVQCHSCVDDDGASLVVKQFHGTCHVLCDKIGIVMSIHGHKCEFLNTMVWEKYKIY